MWHYCFCDCCVSDNMIIYLLYSVWSQMFFQIMKMFPSFENVSLTCLISFLVSVSVRVVRSLSCSPWLVFVSVFSPSRSTTSTALPVGRQHVLRACQISHTFLMCVVVCKFCPTVIIVVSRQPIGCMLRELFPNISQGPWCCVSHVRFWMKGAFFIVFLSLHAHPDVIPTFMRAMTDRLIYLWLHVWGVGEKRRLSLLLLWVCWDYRELSLTSRAQPVQDKIRQNEVARSNIETL